MAAWLNWVAQGIWILLVFGWPVTLILVCSCCCGAGRQGLLRDAILVYAAVLTLVWYAGPSQVVIWLWQGLAVTGQFIGLF
jgi:hypothetical protein